jgi:uncharacterized protein (DUF1015 family)
MAAPVEDRLRLTRALGATLSCIYAVFRGPNRRLAAWLDDATRAEPFATLVDGDGVEHRVWETHADHEVGEALDRESLMIADGHHRYATALRYRDEMRALRGPGPWDATMMLLVDATLEDVLARLDPELRFTPDAVAAEEAVRDRTAVAAYFLPATDAATIRSVVDGGGQLPQKSTFFWPKPRTGLVIRRHQPA